MITFEEADQELLLESQFNPQLPVCDPTQPWRSAVDDATVGTVRLVGATDIRTPDPLTPVIAHTCSADSGGAGDCEYLEDAIVLVDADGVEDARLKVAIAHEFGHVLGLGHQGSDCAFFTPKRDISDNLMDVRILADQHDLGELELTETQQEHVHNPGG